MKRLASLAWKCPMMVAILLAGSWISTRGAEPEDDSARHQGVDRRRRPLGQDAGRPAPLRRAQDRRVGQDAGEALAPRLHLGRGLREVHPAQPGIVPADHRRRRRARPRRDDGTVRRRRQPGAGGRDGQLPRLPGALAGAGRRQRRGLASGARGQAGRPRRRPARRRPDARNNSRAWPRASPPESQFARRLAENGFRSWCRRLSAGRSTSPAIRASP